MIPRGPGRHAGPCQIVSALGVLVLAAAGAAGARAPAQEAGAPRATLNLLVKGTAAYRQPVDVELRTALLRPGTWASGRGVRQSGTVMQIVFSNLDIDCDLDTDLPMAAALERFPAVAGDSAFIVLATVGSVVSAGHSQFLERAIDDLRRPGAVAVEMPGFRFEVRHAALGKPFKKTFNPSGANARIRLVRDGPDSLFAEIEVRDGPASVAGRTPLTTCPVMANKG